MAVPNEDQYLKTFLEPIRKCKDYRPKFGQNKQGDGFSLIEFKSLYSGDPFYSWIGLDSDLIYAAHRASGGMTSVYRQIGIGCERLFRSVITDATDYTDSSFATWSYKAKTSSGKEKTLSLDGRLELSEVKNLTVLHNVQEWITVYCDGLSNVTPPPNGIVFEVRQGYKSKDSKRQNADIDSAAVAWAHGYLPVFAIFSTQVDTDIVLRYRNNRCGIITGVMANDSQISVYAFLKNILGYDLEAFFKTHSNFIKSEINAVLEILLSTE